MDETKKDLLFVVPDQFFVRYKRIIKYALWAANSKATFDIISGDQFAQIYGEMPASEAHGKISQRYVEVGHPGDLSKREWAAYDKLMTTLKALAKQQKEPTP